MDDLLRRAPDLTANLVGYGAAIILPLPGLLWIAHHYWEVVALQAGFTRREARKGRRRDLPALIGLIERFLYVASLLAGVAEFIAVWLALKVAGNWNGWSEGRTPVGREHENDAPKVEGRHVFNIFLLGSGLSVVWALAGWASVIWIATDQSTLAAQAIATLLVGTYGLAGSLCLWKRRILKQRAA